MKTMLSKALSMPVLAAGLLVSAMVPVFAAGGGHGPEIHRQHWSFGGFKGQYDKNQLQRGFQIYQNVCANCHGLSRVRFRNLVEKGGPEFPEEEVKALAAGWPNQIPEMSGEGAVADKKGNVLKRPAKLADPILGPYLNDAEARAMQNGALPPDLSLMAKARNVENHSGWVKHVLVDMPMDVLTGYQEGGADYIYALLTGYVDPPADVTVAEGMNYNTAFPGNQIAMVQPLSKDAPFLYQDKSGTLEQNAADVSAFLAWAADPSLNDRKRLGWQVLLYLLITTVLLFLGKKRIWAKIPH